MKIRNPTSAAFNINYFPKHGKFKTLKLKSINPVIHNS